MAVCARDAAKESGISFDDIKSVGIDCPGAIDKKNGNIEFSNNFDFYHANIVARMEVLIKKKFSMLNCGG